MTGPRWIKQWINELALLNERFRDDDGRVDFAALGREEYQFRMALITHDFSKSNRAKETYSVANKAYAACSENGKKGGRPPSKVALPRNKQEVIEFAADNGLDVDDASTWAEQNLRERRGKDKDGKPIDNWKGALVNYCKAMSKRRTA